MTTPVPEYGGCPWPVGDCLDEATEPDVAERSIALASATLQRLTGYRVSNCPVTVRPCKPARAYGYNVTIPSYVGPFHPGIDKNGAWVNSCGCGWDCGCEVTAGVTLPAPVGRIDEVKVNGAVIDPANYRLIGNRLVRTDGIEWPAQQDLTLPDTAEGTFSVTYLNAYPVDSLGSNAACVLAKEYARAMSGSNKCRLPAGVTAIVRQGVTMEIASGAFPGGLTGIREVDAFITLWNPQGLTRSASVWTPDLNRAERG